ncbi:MAG: MFS transporter [Pseudomonadaceae bacterium]|nr:MFS transporter [Pseudomonadaceae bacterium]
MSTSPSPASSASARTVSDDSLSLLGKPAATPLGYQSWALYEWARNPYVILITIYVFAPYFSSKVVGDPVEGQALLGFANTVSGFIIACAAPFLGAIADKSGRRKPWIAAYVAIMVPAIFALWWAEPNGGGIGINTTLILIIIIAIALEFSSVFHNAMLPSVAPRSKIGLISGLAIAYGNVASVGMMAFVLIAFALPGVVDWSWIPEGTLWGLDQSTSEDDRVVAPLAAVWLLVFCVPLLLFTPDGQTEGVPIRQAVRQGLADVLVTVKALKHYANVAKYLAARMLFNDGLVGILIFGGVYVAGVFDWGTIELLIFGLVTSVFAALGGFIGGKVDDALGSKRTLFVAIGGTSFLLAVMLTVGPDSIIGIPVTPGEKVWDVPYFSTLPELIYLANNQVFGIFVTIGFASARSMMARLVPPTLATQFFGLYALSGTATAFLAPALVSLFTTAFDSQRAGFGSLMILLVAGFVGLMFVREEQATVAGQPPTT